MNSLILASTSPYRQELMKKLGIPFTCQRPLCDENALKAKGIETAKLSAFLAQAKAQSILAEHPQATIIGSDQVLSFQGHLLDKPGSYENAKAQLASLQGQMHELITSICVCSPLGEFQHTNSTRIQLRPLTQEQIHRYVELDNPIDCAGSYKIESFGITLIEKIETEDHTAIIGMPMLALIRILTKIGFRIP